MLTVQEGTHIKIKDTICYNEMRLLRQFDASWYAAMKRSTNGGGENSPVLERQDDYYELCMMELEEYCAENHYGFKKRLQIGDNESEDWSGDSRGTDPVTQMERV